jgi:transposase InsO family protein/ribosomal protein S28E/S33
MVSSADPETGEVSMVFWSLTQILTLLLDIFTILGITNGEKDLEIIILRQQIRILQRTVKPPPRISDPEKMVLATLMVKYKKSTNDARQRLHQVMLIFKPDTVLRWHRELVRRKWTFKPKGKPGRPAMSSELEALIVRLAKENPRWGYDKIQGELLKLGYRLGATSVRNILKRHSVIPVSQRSTGSWRSLMKHYKDQILACDFFTVETIWLKTIYVLFFIELGTRQIHLAGCTTNPDMTWVTQQARNMVWDLKDNDRDMAFLIHDHDTKFTTSFDTVLSSEGIEILHTPYRAPRANAFAERWVRSAREECLDYILILNENHLRRVLKEYREYYNYDRPHQGINQHFPISGPVRNTRGPIRRRDIVGGIIHDYYRQPTTLVSRYG